MKDFPDYVFVPNEPKISIPNPKPLNPWEDKPSPYELMKENAENSSKQLKAMQDQLEPLKELSESAKRQADSAESIAQSSNELAQKAQKDAGNANKKSHTATIISIASLAVAVLTNLDKITANVHWLITLFQKIPH